MLSMLCRSSLDHQGGVVQGIRDDVLQKIRRTSSQQCWRWLIFWRKDHEELKNPENNPWIPNHPEDNPWILGDSWGFMIHGIYFQDSWGDPGGWVDLMRLENRNGEHVNLGLGKQAESGCTWFILLFYGCFRPWVYLVYLLLRCVLPFSPSLGSFLWSCLPVLPKMIIKFNQEWWYRFPIESSPAIKIFRGIPMTPWNHDKNPSIFWWFLLVFSSTCSSWYYHG